MNQPTKFSAGTDLYASVYFIESPKGMKYTAKWLLNNQEIKSEEKEMVSNRKGIMVYPLEADKVVAGKWKLQIIYKDEILSERNSMAWAIIFNILFVGILIWKSILFVIFLEEVAGLKRGKLAATFIICGIAIFMLALFNTYIDLKTPIL